MSPAASVRSAVLLLLASALAAQEPTAELAALREKAAGAENRGLHAEAADLYLQLVTKEPARADWVLAAGRCLGASGRFREAIELLEKKSGQFAPLPDLPAMLARTYLLRVERSPGIHPELDYREAERVANEVLKGNPDHLDARLILAQARYAMFDLEGAEAAATEAARRHPQHPGAHVVLGRIAFDEYRMRKEAIEAEDPEEPRRSELVSQLDVARKRAQKAFTEAAKLDPLRSYPLVMLGDVAARDRDTDAALQYWGDALAADPVARVEHDWIRAHTEPAARVAFYMRARERYEAREGASPARAATLRFYCGLAHYEAGAWQPARAEFEAARAQNPDFVNADYYAAMCAWRTKDEDGAEAHAAAFAAVSAPRFADVLRAIDPEPRAEVAGIVKYLGDRAFQQGRKDRSRDLNHVTACLLDSADSWNNYAFLCRETQKFEEAFVGYQHAIEREPDSPQLWNDAAVVLHYHLGGDGNHQRAKQMYEKALDLARTQLASEGASEIVRRRAESAKADAEANLKELAR